ncbi:DUF1641 domain-containing protein [Salinirubellus salinus]|uniref:DUF1641 domain-containing protein n=1 Tax=Salinirubellus salinus TaxID=1364945 RepID=A0A9E7UBA2_9EURY|nr:DUF1641 domain-containing protein [Salinirubellus salinus]UWM54619.1 DUF1641 domain-containing protein [Salinirubellus salinus]
MTDGSTNEAMETERPEETTETPEPTEALADERLVAAIEENPEAVAAFVERLDSVNELLDVVALGQDAMTDEMVVSLARMGSNVGELADTAGDPDTRDGLARLLEGVGNAQRADPESASAMALLKSLRDPEVRRGLSYLVALARGIGAADPDAE